MKNLIDYYSDAGEGSPAPLSELRLGAEPAMVLLFTAACEEVLLHYVDDDAVRAYVRCPGPGCPMCHTGAKPARFDLLPVFDAESGEVKVLRVPDSRRPDGLAAKLLPHLQAHDAADVLILISRVQRVEYCVEARALGPDASRGEREILAFSERLEGGLALGSAFSAMSHAELAEVPKVAARLAAYGGWSPPDGPAAVGGGSPEEAGGA